MIQRKLAMPCAVTLLFLFHTQWENQTQPFALSLILWIFEMVVASEEITKRLDLPFVGALAGIHEGSLADATVECLSNRLMVNCGDRIEVEVIVGICSARVKLGSFASNRLLVLLKKMWLAKAVWGAEQLLCGIWELFQRLPENVPLLSFCGDFRKVLKEMAESGTTGASHIVRAVAATEAALQVFDETQRTSILNDCAREILAEDGRQSLGRKQFEMTGEIEGQWLEWLRGLFWNLLPELSVQFSQEDSASTKWWMF
jgi:hypothetical protein